MDISVLWVPDEKTGERLTRMHRAYARAAGTNEGCFPHVSLGVYYGIDAETLRRHTRAFAREVHPFWIRYEKLALLSDAVIALMARADGALMALHQKYHGALDGYADEWTSLSGGNYKPHTTMLHMKDGGAGAFFDAVDAGFEPFDARIVGLALSRAYPENRYELLDMYALK